MESTINRTILKELMSHYRKLGLKYRLKGLPYERCAELSWIIDYLSSQFQEKLRYLDIGSGESPLPTFLSTHSRWHITCLDKCSWVRKQHSFYGKVQGEAKGGADDRFRVVEADLHDVDFPADYFDIITLVSVIEHFPGGSDSTAMVASARLLRPGGRLFLTTPVNDRFFAEFYLRRSVYSYCYNGSPVFYQRHHDVDSIERRLVQPSALGERHRIYFGDYGFQCFEKLLQLPKPMRILYAWRTPSLAQRFLSYRSYPVSRPKMRMNTASGLILVLEKPFSFEPPPPSGIAVCAVS